MKHNQTFHELLIPLLVEGIGAQSYLELGTHQNETIGKVKCLRRYGVDLNPTPLDEVGVTMFTMSTQQFIEAIAPIVGPFDVVLIDADHSYEAVKADFNGIWPHVSLDGLVLIHDVNPETVADTAPGFCGDSWKFARELHEALGEWDYPEYECMALNYHPGLMLVRKRTIWGPKE